MFSRHLASSSLLYNVITTTQCMPTSMTSAAISLLPQPGKAHFQMSNCYFFRCWIVIIKFLLPGWHVCVTVTLCSISISSASYRQWHGQSWEPIHVLYLSVPAFHKLLRSWTELLSWWGWKLTDSVAPWIWHICKFLIPQDWLKHDVR